MKEILIRHIRAYPAMTVTDAVKLCYQSAFGGGHLITDEARALAFLHTERKQLLQSAETPLTLWQVATQRFAIRTTPPEIIAVLST